MATFRFVGRDINIHWNGYDIKGPAGTVFSIPDQLYEEFEGDLRGAEPSLEWIDTNEFLTFTNSVSVTSLDGTFPISVTTTTSGKIIGVTSSTASDGFVLTANGSGGVAWEALPGGATGITNIIGTSPISAAVSGTSATISLTANYSTSTHLHDSDYVNVGGDTMSGQLLVSSATTTSTVGFGEIIVAKGTSYGSITVNATDDHLHLRSKNPIEVLEQSGPTMQGLRARGLGVNSSHTYPTLIDDGITFGEDANLYRVSANALKTDDALEVVGTLTNGGTSVSLSTHTHDYQASGTYVNSVIGTSPASVSTSSGTSTVSIIASSINSTHIADNAIVAAKIAASSVGVVAISSGTAANGTVITANGSGGVTFEAVASSNISINAQTGTTYTLVLSDAAKLIELSNTSAITFTIPMNSSVAFPVGTKIDLLQTNTGQVTVGGAGVTLNTFDSRTKLGGQWAAASIIKRATDTWVIIGNITS